MSEPLSNAAPAEAEAVAPVGSPAPSADGEVVEGSAPQSEDEAVVPAARFNGLMGKFNQTQNALAEARAEIESLRAFQNSQEQPVENSAEVEALRNEIASLRETLMTDKVEKARRAALEEFPAAKPLADLITSDDPEQIREVARLISERLGGSAPAAEANEATGEEAAPPAAEAPAPETPAPVVGGGAAFSGSASISDRVAEAVKNRDFKAFLRAKNEEAEMATLGG